MTPRPRMIAIDMDGTLVHPGGTVTEVNRSAIQRARDAGARIVIATGRRHSYAMKTLHGTGFLPHDIVLSSNGAVARTLAGSLLFRQTMPLATARWFCAAADEFRNCLVFTFDTVREDGTEAPGALVLEELEELHSSIEKWMTANAADIRRVRPVEDALQDGSMEPIQAMLCGNLQRMERAYTLLNVVNDDGVTLTRTMYPARDLCILDVVPAGCSKGSGLQRLMEMEGFSQDDLMAIGDNWNDLAMLELARWPMLMGNAPEELRLIAEQRGWTVTCHHHEDGVAEAIATCFPADHAVR